MRLIAVLTLAATLAAATHAEAQKPKKQRVPSHFPAGTYTTTISKKNLPASYPKNQADSTIGKWTVKVDDNLHVTVDFNGKQVLQGQLHVTGNRVEFDDKDTGPYACHAAASYTYSETKKGALRFTKVRDTCQGRDVVLTSHSLKTGS